MYAGILNIKLASPGPVFGRLTVLLIKDSIAAYLEAPALVVKYNELRGPLGRFNHVR